MKNEVLNKIRDFAVNELKGAYSYCGLADGDNDVFINSDDGNGNDIKIIIKVESES